MAARPEPRRRDLGTRGRVMVAAAAVGTAGILAGWMAATDHSAATATSSSGASSSGTSSSGASAAPNSSSSTPSVGSDDDRSAVPGSATPSFTPSDASTRGS